MRLHRLELTGFGPFRERQSVDFEAFERDGIFLIAGRTGAGKSSILDGVCFALYGSVPRYDSGEKRLRSDYCEPDEPTEVRLEFTVGERRWRVTRAPEYQRPARRGGGLTTEPTRAELEELVDGAWIGRAARPRDVGLLLDEVLGLNAQQFQQVILLAQNKFSRFLLASGTERQSLLRALFGTRRYEEYARELGERSKLAQREVDALGERARTLLEQAERLLPALEPDDGGAGGADGASAAEGSAGGGAGAADDGGGASGDGGGASGDGARPEDLVSRRAAVELGEQRAAYRLETRVHEREEAERRRAAADAEHAARTALAKSQSELLQARERLAALDRSADRVDADRARVVRARAAESLRAPLDAVRRAGATADAAREAEREAVAAWEAVAGAAGIDPTQDLDALIERVTGELAVWAVAAAKEAELAAREGELTAASARVGELERDIAALDAQREHVPGELARIDAELQRVRDDAARADDARERRAGLASRLDAARDAEALAAVLREAETVHRDAAAAAAAAAAGVARLLQRRLDGYAGELASTLVEGEPCAVCGSPEHPHPAEAAAEPVTDDDLAAAEAHRDETIAHERAAADAARTARERHATAAARAGGDGVTALEEQLAAADVQVAEATDAVARRDALTAQRDQLSALDAEAEAARTALVDAAHEQRTRVAALGAGIEDSRAAVAEARGSFASVAERLAEVTAVRDAARACAQARAEAQRAGAALAEAVADADARLAASVFDDASDAEAALLGRHEVDELAARIADHDAQLAATRGRLLDLELELAGTPDEPVDIAASRASLEEADAARTAALEAERDARHLATGLRDLAVQIDAAYAGVAARAADVAALTRLADTVAGRAPNTMKMDLETFVLAAELEEIVAAANVRLADMSSGRYRLQHTDARAARGAASGLGLEVFDAYTGQSRPAQSLSGGETFLASLALALGLAEVVTARAGGVRLDTLFIDEGFGSLDEETLELAMRTLDELRAGGRTVGVISHVAAMKEQLPAQLSVEAAAHGPSVVRQFAVV